MAISFTGGPINRTEKQRNRSLAGLGNFPGGRICRRQESRCTKMAVPGNRAYLLGRPFDYLPEETGHRHFITGAT
jgi:hypothetical protein